MSRIWELFVELRQRREFISAVAPFLYLLVLVLSISKVKRIYFEMRI